MGLGHTRIKGIISCIYVITFPDGSFYIGSTSNFNQRVSGYKSAFKNCIGSVNKLLSSKYSEYQHAYMSILEEISDISMLKHYEDFHIKTTWDSPLSLNRSKSAFSNDGMVNCK
jgi:predicted GIY-YIG superfamily endonuclease